MTYQDQQTAFDQRAHACYVEAASALSPSMQGRLRAARRTALATPARRRTEARGQRPWPLLPVGAVAAGLLAVAVGLRWQPNGESYGPAPAGMSAAQQPPGSDQATRKPGPRSSTPPDVAATPATAPGQPEATATTQAADAALAGVRSTDDKPLLMLDEDPDFYLWLGGDDPLPVNAEPGHDPT